MNLTNRLARLFALVLLPCLLLSANCSQKKKGLLLWPLALMGGGGGGGGGSARAADENGEALPESLPEAEQEVATEGAAQIVGSLVILEGDNVDPGFDLSLVTVKLVDAEGATVATAQVNADGTFSFDISELPNNNYRVLIPDGNGANHAHVDFNFVFDPTTTTTRVDLPPLVAQRLHYSSGPAMVRGGAQSDGFQGENGSPLVPAGALPAGTVVLLLDAGGDQIARTTLDGHGNFVFENPDLANGNYLIRVLGSGAIDPAYGRPFSDVEALVRFIFEGQNQATATTLVLSPLVSAWKHATGGEAIVRGALYNLANTGDLGGIRVVLKDAAGDEVASAETDSAGGYSLRANIESGVYTVEADADAYRPVTTSVNFVADPTGTGARTVRVADLGIRPEDSLVRGSITDGSRPVSGAVLSFRPAADQPASKLLYLLDDETLAAAARVWIAEKCGDRDPLAGNCDGAYATYFTKSYTDNGSGELALSAAPGRWRFYVSAAGYFPSSDPADGDEPASVMFLNGQPRTENMTLRAHTARSRITGRVTVLDEPGAKHSYCQEALGQDCSVSGTTRQGGAIPGLVVVMLGNTHNGRSVAHLATTDANGEYTMTDLHVVLPAGAQADDARVDYAVAEYLKYLESRPSQVVAENGSGIASASDTTDATLYRDGSKYYFKVNTYAVFAVDPRAHIRTAQATADNSLAVSADASGTPAYGGAVLDVTGRAAHHPRRTLRGVVSDAVSTAPLVGATVELGVDTNPDPAVVDFTAARMDPVPLRTVSRLSAAADQAVAAVTTGVNGAYTFANIDPGTYILRVSKGNYVSGEILVIVPESGDPGPVNPQLVVDGEPGNLTGWIKLPGGFFFQETYTLEITHPTSGNRPLAGVQPASLTGGPAQFSSAPQYSVFGLTPGQWKIRFVSPGFQTVEGLVNIQSGATTTFDIITMVPGSHPPATVSGRALNALTNAGVADLVVRLRPGVNITTGPFALDAGGNEIAAVTTGATNGTFAIPNVPPGDYTLEVSGAGFATTYRTVISAGTDTPAAQDILVSPTLAASEVRIVLAWNDQPRDLDSHLEFGAAKPWQAVWNDRTPLPSGANLTRGDISLDIDVTWGRGPETVTLKSTAWNQPRLGYSIYNWSRAVNRDTLLSIGGSGATVRVFKSQGLVRSYTAGPGQTADWWQLFCLNAAREITDIGQGSCKVSDFFNASRN